jgi:hypothetical protein
MMPTLLELIETIEVGDPLDSGPLRIFPLRWTIDEGPPHDTLDEAMAASSIEITEVGEQGSVPSILVRNRSDRRIFLMAGEHLVGAKQDRVLNASLMVPALGELPIPVSCVEAGRWRHRSAKFASGGTMSHGGLRAMMSKQASDAYHAEGRPSSDQGEVWREVSRKLMAMGSSSETHAFSKVYEDHGADLAELKTRLPVPERASGAAFAVGNRLVGLDLFDGPSTLARLWPKLLGAYALDAIEPREGAPTAPPASYEIAHWVKAGGSAKAESFQSPGLGSDIRLVGPDVVGAGLVVEGRPIHVELFRPANESPA